MPKRCELSEEMPPSYRHCPICGVRLDPVTSTFNKHRCKEYTLKSIDSSMQVERCEGDHDRRTYGGRLEEGFQILHDEDF